MKSKALYSGLVSLTIMLVAACCNGQDAAAIERGKRATALLVFIVNGNVQRYATAFCVNSVTAKIDVEAPPRPGQ